MARKPRPTSMEENPNELLDEKENLDNADQNGPTEPDVENTSVGEDDSVDLNDGEENNDPEEELTEETPPSEEVFEETPHQDSIPEEKSVVEGGPETLVEPTDGQSQSEVQPTPDEVVVEEKSPIVPPVEEPTTPPTQEELLSKGNEIVTTLENKLNDVDLLLEATRKYQRGEIGWSDAECKEYLENGRVPPKTKNGNWVYDRRRPDNLNALTRSETLDFLAGDLSLPDVADHDLIWDIIYSRFKVSPCVTKEDAVALILTYKQPDVTPCGLLVNDQLRDLKPLNHLTYPEVRAALLGHITLPHSMDDLYNRLRQLFEVSKSFPLNQLIDSLESERYRDMSELAIVSKLNEFKAVRNNAGSLPLQHGQSYASLFKAIKLLFKNKSYVAFRENWIHVIDFFKREQNGLMSPSRRFEYWNMVPLEPQEVVAMESLITFLVDASNQERRLRINANRVNTVAALVCRTEEQAQFLRQFHLPE